MDHLRASLLGAEMRPADAAASDLSKSREAPAHQSLPSSRRGPVTPAAGSEREQVFCRRRRKQKIWALEKALDLLFSPQLRAHGAKRTPGRCFGHD